MRTAESVKEASEALLTQLGVPINPALPLVETPEEITARNATEVAKQMVAVSYMVRVGHGYPAAAAKNRLIELGILGSLGSKTMQMLQQRELSAQDKINLTWQAEGIQALAWALGLVQLDHTRECDDDLASRGPSQDQEADFILNATLRPVSELQEQVDLIYRMHWAAVNARFTGTKVNLNESILSERRRALDWMYGVDEDWDEVPLDT